MVASFLLFHTGKAGADAPCENSQVSERQKRKDELAAGTPHQTRLFTLLQNDPDCRSSFLFPSSCQGLLLRNRWHPQMRSWPSYADTSLRKRIPSSSFVDSASAPSFCTSAGCPTSRLEQRADMDDPVSQLISIAVPDLYRALSFSPFLSFLLPIASTASVDIHFHFRIRRFFPARTTRILVLSPCLLTLLLHRWHLHLPRLLCCEQRRRCCCCSSSPDFSPSR